MSTPLIVLAILSFNILWYTCRGLEGAYNHVQVCQVYPVGCGTCRSLGQAGNLWGVVSGGLLDLKLGSNCETDRESSSSKPVKVAHTGEQSPTHCPSFRGLQ